MALPLQFSSNAAARADETQRAAAEGARAFFCLLEGWQPLVRLLQAMLHVVIHITPWIHHAGIVLPRSAILRAVPRDSTAPHPIACRWYRRECERAFARADRAVCRSAIGGSRRCATAFNLLTDRSSLPRRRRPSPPPMGH